MRKRGKKMDMKFRMDTGRLEQSLTNALGNIGNNKKLLDKIGGEMVFETQENFKKEQEYDGKSFVPLSPVTIKRRRGRGRGKILQDTGELRKDYNRYKIVGNSVKIVADKRYAASHHYGDLSRNIPRRRVIGFTKKNIRKYEKMIIDWIPI